MMCLQGLKADRICIDILIYVCIDVYWSAIIKVHTLIVEIR